MLVLLSDVMLLILFIIHDDLLSISPKGADEVLTHDISVYQCLIDGERIYDKGLCLLEEGFRACNSIRLFSRVRVDWI